MCKIPHGEFEKNSCMEIFFFGMNKKVLGIPLFAFFLMQKCTFFICDIGQLHRPSSLLKTTILSLFYLLVNYNGLEYFRSFIELQLIIPTIPCSVFLLWPMQREILNCWRKTQPAKAGFQRIARGMTVKMRSVKHSSVFH